MHNIVVLYYLNLTVVTGKLRHWCLLNVIQSDLFLFSLYILFIIRLNPTFVCLLLRCSALFGDSPSIFTLFSLDIPTIHTLSLSLNVSLSLSLYLHSHLSTTMLRLMLNAAMLPIPDRNFAHIGCKAVTQNTQQHKHAQLTQTLPSCLSNKNKFCQPPTQLTAPKNKQTTHLSVNYT